MVARRRGAGRPGALDEARTLVTLISSLSETGDAIDPVAVAQRMGIDLPEAEKLVSLILSSTLLGDVGLPLVEEDGYVTLIEGGGVRGRRLRLSHDETLALVAALERMGVSADDPLRRRLELSLSSEPVDARLVRLLLAGGEGGGGLSSALAAIGRALSRGLALTFSYQKPQADPEERRVACLGLRCEDNTWFLDAYDLDRRGERTFRVDRMTQASCKDRVTLPKTRGGTPKRTVTITFTDPAYLDLLPWHDLHITERADGVVEAETPYYGGEWLVRMLAACAGTARAHDEELSGLVREYARHTLND